MDQNKKFSIDCFLLTAQCRDFNNRFEITLWATTEENKSVKIVIDNFHPLFFVDSTLPPTKSKPAIQRKTLELYSLHGTKTDCLYFRNQASMQQCAQNLRSEGYRVYESDVKPLERYLMERMVFGGMRVTGYPITGKSGLFFKNPHIRGSQTEPNLKILSIDIETSVSTGEIYSIASYSNDKSMVYIRGDVTEKSQKVCYCKNESELLSNFFSYVRSTDPDIIIGWNVVDFDMNVICQRALHLNIPFSPGRESGSKIVQSKTTHRKIALIPGRIILDIPTMLRAYHHTFEQYSLDFVSHKLLGKGKTISKKGNEKIKEIDHLFRYDKSKLAHYNLTDAQLALEIFEKSGILQVAIQKSKRSGQLLDKSGGSVASFDYLYLPRIHRAGYVANDLQDISAPPDPLPGGYVLEPRAGFYRDVFVLDFRSLYPSIIMTFLIDPLGFNIEEHKITNPAGTHFSQTKHILPEIIEDLMEARAMAKKSGNSSLSQAIKILMNSFYGVLGSTGCRFFSQEIASTITITGQYILKKSIQFIESRPDLKVIYGDTDSLFVLPDQKLLSQNIEDFGKNIAAKVTEWLSEHIKEKFNAGSALKLQFETHFSHIFIPAVRGALQGSKKHYCGALSDSYGNIKQLVFKGMESARSDWTDLAKEFQHELFMRVFKGKPVEDYIINTTEQLKAGRLDNKLIYKKRLRKNIHEYTVNIPPHAQAAKLLPSPPPNLIRYCITKDGPQPIERISSPLDYGHYLDCQLEPVADSILEQLNSSFEQIISGQQDLFAPQ
ncbi:DNA polymerase II [Chitinispirillum alkaliphilum]|nr:DNA polymerase II [Chitinispirillum alkaliphilum]